MTATRLSEATLGDVSNRMRLPAYDRAILEPRMVHIGVGAFHRAHQAIHTDDAIEADGIGWGVTGISMRSDTAGEQLRSQDGLFSVSAKDADTEDVRIVGNLLEVIGSRTDPTRAIEELTRPDVCVVTLTITEKGYYLDPDTGALLVRDKDIANDLAHPLCPYTAPGLLVEAIRQRHQNRAPPLTLISCDNLPGNGRRLARMLEQYADRAVPDLRGHIERDLAFPGTMVDRIVPATTVADIDRAEQLLGVRDEGHVVTEPFTQWIIEDRFAGPVPRWEAGGATLVGSVSEYETAKLRLLNGPHSALAYLGYLSGIEHIHEVMERPVFRRYAEMLMTNEIMDTVVAPASFDLPAYRADLLARFENPALNHRTWQIAMDGSQKLPQRLLGTIRDRIASSEPFERLALAVAAWMIFAGGRMSDGTPIDVRDPLHERTRSIMATAEGNAAKLVDGYLQLGEVFGGLSSVPSFAVELQLQTARILEHGAEGATRKLSL